MIPPWTFGDRIRKARRYRRLTQQEMADRLEVSVNRYSGWEADAHEPRDPVAIARKVQDTTGFPADWILGLKAGQ